jgi:ABC-2 type transport system permease protein
MLRGLWKLTWLEIKIFLREPLGAFGSIILPVLVFVVAGRFMGGRLQTPGSLPPNSCAPGCQCSWQCS